MGCHRTFNGNKYKYWRSESDGITAEKKAAKKRKDGWLVRIVRIHMRQFDLYIMKA